MNPHSMTMLIFLLFLYNKSLRTVCRQFLNEEWNMFEVRKLGNTRGRPTLNPTLFRALELFGKEAKILRF